MLVFSRQLNLNYKLALILHDFNDKSQLQGLGRNIGIFYMHYPKDRIAHTMVFITPVVEHW